MKYNCIISSNILIYINIHISIYYILNYFSKLLYIYIKYIANIEISKLNLKIL